MGWYMLPKPGTKHGPCKGKCKHEDCARTRQDAATPCLHCRKPIGYDSKFYFEEAEIGETKLSHFICAHRAAEARREI